MKKLIISLIIVLGFAVICKAQPTLNDYKYIIVEKQFHFQNEANEYNLNSLTRFLFKKYGFKPIIKGEIYPDDLKSNYCLALISEITAKGTFKTTVTIVLRDCDNNIVFQTEGVTKEKYFDKVYKIGIQKAMEGFNTVNYHYEPKKTNSINDELRSTDISNQNNNNDVEKLNTENKELKEKEEILVVQVEEIKKTPLKDSETAVALKEDENYFIAKSITNGFELINSKSNKVEFIIRNASTPNVFIIKNRNGIIYKKENIWIREYIDGDKTIIELLDIRFQTNED